MSPAPIPTPRKRARSGAGLKKGGHWLALHGTSGGRAERVEGTRMRRTVKTEHHALLGGFFLTHPPIREIRVEIVDPGSPLTCGLGASFVVEDEPYFVELTDPAATHIVLTADYGSSAAGATEGLYPADTSLLPDGKSRVIAYTRDHRRGRGRLYRTWPLPQPRHSRRPRAQPRRYDAAHLSRRVGDRRLQSIAAQRHRLGNEPLNGACAGFSALPSSCFSPGG